MPGKPKPPPGTVSLETLHKRTNGRCNQSTVGNHIRAKRWKLAGLKAGDVVRKGGLIFIRKSAADRLESEARKYTVGVRELSKQLGRDQATLQRRRGFSRHIRRFGGGLYTTPAMRDRLLKEHRPKRESYSTYEAAKLWGVEHHTSVRRMMNEGQVPTISQTINRVPKTWADGNAERMRAGRYPRARGKRWIIPVVGTSMVVGASAEKPDVTQQKHMPKVPRAKGRRSGSRGHVGVDRGKRPTDKPIPRTKAMEKRLRTLERQVIKARNKNNRKREREILDEMRRLHERELEELGGERQV